MDYLTNYCKIPLKREIVELCGFPLLIPTLLLQLFIAGGSKKEKVPWVSGREGRRKGRGMQ